MSASILDHLSEAEVAALVEELDTRGPRYTSYPTAPVWTNGLPLDSYQQALARLGSSGKPFAAYIHLPFCHSRCLYCGCNSVIVNKQDPICRYVEHLEREIDVTADALGERARHAWLHLGGGTPTHTPPDLLARLLDLFLDRIPAVDGAEHSVEVDPRVTTDEHLDLLAERGFRRISVGLQDFNPLVQQTIRREYSVADMTAFIDRCRARGFSSFNIDLIYGLPHQTRESWRETLGQVAALRPERLATFGYAHLPAKIKHQRALPEDKLPSAGDRLGMLLDTNAVFAEHGYTDIGMDHFAAPGDDLANAVSEGRLWRNFMGYTTIRGVEMVGFGASSIGELDEMFVQNTVPPEAYNERVDSHDGWAAARGHVLDDDDRARKALINDLMCNLVVRVPDEADAVPGLRTELDEIIAGLAPFADKGLIVPAEGGWTITPVGRLFLRNLAMPFDRYLPKQQDVTFSKTV